MIGCWLFDSEDIGSLVIVGRRGGLLRAVVVTIGGKVVTWIHFRLVILFLIKIQIEGKVKLHQSSSVVPVVVFQISNQIMLWSRKE